MELPHRWERAIVHGLIGTFDLLGFTHYWARSRQTILGGQAENGATALKCKLLGHFGYFAVIGNLRAYGYDGTFSAHPIFGKHSSRARCDAEDFSAIFREATALELSAWGPIFDR
jgi:hypothetical protein